MSTTIDALLKASNTLRIARDLLQRSIDIDPANIELHEALRDACIRRFEFCVELSWKVSLKVLGLEISAPRPAIRDMARSDLIDDTQIWFDFLSARNESSYAYQEEVAQAIFKEVERLIPELNKLIVRLQKII
ncbi:MAG: nucleotidyltransferase substrate binding protein [Pseudobdellovibrio sp.]|nr:nucleotidyltransferase substrate binding protein [Pseudobdellovibrio sp.]